MSPWPASPWPTMRLWPLHRRFGFTDVGIFSEYAIKDGRYISSAWMRRLFDPGGCAEPEAIDA